MGHALALLIVLGIALANGSAAAPEAAVPVLVELFTAEGCSSCPPADTLLEKMIEQQPASGARIVALGEHVDYWDRLGWKDRFSSAALTARQQVYGARFGNESIYTPQMIVDGRAELVGSDGNAARRALETALAARHGTITVLADAAPSSVALSLTVTGLPSFGRGDHA